MNKVIAIVVDDSELRFLMYEKFAKKLNLAFKYFTNPTKALENAIKIKPEIIFVDYMMPEMNGIEFVYQIRSVNDTVPIIMLTGSSDDDVKIHALEAGVTDFLSIPYNEAEFQARIKNTLKMRQMQKLLETRNELLEEKVELATRDILYREQEALMVLAKAAEYKDVETELHTERVARYSRLLAKRIGLSETEQDIIFNSAPLHDIGKIGVPDEILLKKGKLCDSEFDIMKQHTIIGFNILENTKSVYLEAGKTIALFHHERFDGAGYPYGKKGFDIPVMSRIVAIADVFDALLSKRPYKEAWSFMQAISYLNEQKGKQFDPVLVEEFLKDIGELKEIMNCC